MGDDICHSHWTLHEREVIVSALIGNDSCKWSIGMDLWYTVVFFWSSIRRGFAKGFVNYKKGCTRLAVASDKVYQLLAHGRWFSPGTPASSTTKTGRHDIAEIQVSTCAPEGWVVPALRVMYHNLDGMRNTDTYNNQNESTRHLINMVAFVHHFKFCCHFLWIFFYWPFGIL
jgi:hypothetical protein